MKKILNEWKIFLKENSRFEMDPEIVKHLRLILFGKMDYPQLYKYPDGGEAYNKFQEKVAESLPMLTQVYKDQELKGRRKNTEKRTPERKKIDRVINRVGKDMANIAGGLSYYWVPEHLDFKANAVLQDPNYEEKLKPEYVGLDWIAQQKFDIFIAQLSKAQLENFRNNYKQYLAFDEGSIGHAPTDRRNKQQLLGGELVDDVYLANEGREIVRSIAKKWATGG